MDQTRPAEPPGQSNASSTITPVPKNRRKIGFLPDLVSSWDPSLLPAPNDAATHRTRIPSRPALLLLRAPRVGGSPLA